MGNWHHKKKKSLRGGGWEKIINLKGKAFKKGIIRDSLAFKQGFKG